MSGVGYGCFVIADHRRDQHAVGRRVTAERGADEGKVVGHLDLDEVDVHIFQLHRFGDGLPGGPIDYQIESLGQRRNGRSLEKSRHDHHEEDEIEDGLTGGDAGGGRERGEDDGQCAAQTGPRERNVFSFQDSLNGSMARTTDSGRPTRNRMAVTAKAGIATPGSSAGKTSSPRRRKRAMSAPLARLA